MKILDVNDNELQEEELDLELGYLIQDQILKEHHDAIEPQKEKSHYIVTAFLFADGSSLEINDQDDPHIVKTDVSQGLFKYKNLQGEEKIWYGTETKKVIDQPEIIGQEAWDEFENIQRYILYTEEELNKKQEKEEQEELLINGLESIQSLANQIQENNQKIKNFQEELIEVKEQTLPEILQQINNILEETTSTIDDFTLMLADFFGRTDAIYSMVWDSLNEIVEIKVQQYFEKQHDINEETTEGVDE